MADSRQGSLENSSTPEMPRDTAPVGPAGGDAGRPPGESRRTCVRLIALIAALLAAGVSAWACYVWITGEDGFDFRRFTFRGGAQPGVYAVRGEVWFNGEPLDRGHVEARPVNTETVPDRVIGPINEDGTFELYTDFGGRLMKGAPAGEYKLLLMVYHPSRPLQPPQPLLPPEYYDQSRTPLRITVTSDATKNHFVLKETGEIQPGSG